MSKIESKKVNPRLAKIICPNCDRCITINNYKRHRSSLVCMEVDLLGGAELKKRTQFIAEATELLNEIRNTRIYTESDDDAWFTSYCCDSFEQLLEMLGYKG